MSINSTVAAVSENIVRRSKTLRAQYLQQVADSRGQQPERGQLSCGNLAHGFAACESTDKGRIRMMDAVNIGIVTAFNDMLSAHQPYETYPETIKSHIREIGSTAQVAGGVPAMCDGVTQGMPGMELSLFSRDIIAQSTAIALSHQMFDGVICLGICDKIVPGLLMGALSFGHLPMLFIPAGPMPSGLPNREKVRIRQLFAEGKVGREALLDAESSSYHSAGTCTFYGTANSNQLLMEAMGLQLPGGSFVNPESPLREALTKVAAQHITRITASSKNYKPLGEVVDERSIVNAIVALLASGGSTNHSIHIIAIARAAGIVVTWDDFNELSKVVPLLARVYPNGQADINHFHAAGGTGYLFNQLIDAGLMHGNARTMWGDTLADYTQEPVLIGDELQWRKGSAESLDKSVLSTVSKPFDPEGGLRLLTGNLGRAVIKVSAVAPEHRVVEGPAVVISNQNDLKAKFDTGELDRNCVVVARFQGPKANGMPELHKLTPILGVLQDRGFNVALVTDGRMSGASGKVAAAIHVSPEACLGGAIAKVLDGDWIRVDAENGILHCDVNQEILVARPSATLNTHAVYGEGRELFAGLRKTVSQPEQGASVLFDQEPY